jgi:CheY-like chemotaxis protein
VSNALRYTHAGGVLLAARRRGTAVRIEVWDTGPGIPIEHRRAIFEEFQRLEHASPWGEKGLGLGLSICERISRLLGHRLDLRSRLGRGSVFSVDVPLGVVATVATAAPGVDAGMLPRLRILCLDNDPDILDGMRALLERWGMTVCTATGIDEALSRVDGFAPQAILADYHLHDRVEGLDALDELRARCDAPGALVTADASDALAEDARRRGYPLLRKPVKPAALRALISSLARQRRPRGDAAAPVLVEQRRRE